MNICDLCGKPNTSLKAYLVQTGHLSAEGVNKRKVGFKTYEYTNIYTDVKWHRFQVCKNCRWKWNLIYRVIMALIISILTAIILAIIGESTYVIMFLSIGFFPSGFLLSTLFFRLKNRLTRKALNERMSEQARTGYAVLKFKKS